MISAAQIRAARSLLNLQQEDVSEATGLKVRYLSEIENERSAGKADALDKLELYYTARGIEFTEYDGVRKQPTGMRVLRGQSGFREMYDDIYNTAQRGNVDITLFNGVSDFVRDGLGSDFLKMHVARMVKCKNKFRFRVIVEEEDTAYLGNTYCEYKWFPTERFNDKTIYTYGSKLAFINFDGEITVTLFDQKELANSWRFAFDVMWDTIASEPPRA